MLIETDLPSALAELPSLDAVTRLDRLKPDCRRGYLRNKITHVERKYASMFEESSEDLVTWLKLLPKSHLSADKLFETSADRREDATNLIWSKA